MSDMTEALNDLETEFDDLSDQVMGVLIDDPLDVPMAEQGFKLAPARVNATLAVLESADLDIRTCAHEIAYALAALAGLDVSLDAPPAEFEHAARKVRAFIRQFPRCQLKGAS